MSAQLKYDKKLRQCVPRYVGYAYPFVGSSSSRNGGGDDGSGSGNGNGNGNGGNGNGVAGGNGNVGGGNGAGGGNGGQEQYLVADVRKMPDGNSVFMQMYLKKVDE